MHAIYRSIPQRSWDAIVGGVSRLKGQDVGGQLGWVLQALLIEPEDAEEFFEQNLEPLGEFAEPSISDMMGSTIPTLSAMGKDAVLDTIATWLEYQAKKTNGLAGLTTRIYEINYRLGVWMDAVIVEDVARRSDSLPTFSRSGIRYLAVVELAKKYSLGNVLSRKETELLESVSQSADDSSYLSAAFWYLAANITATPYARLDLISTTEIGSIIDVLTDASMRPVSLTDQSIMRKATSVELAVLAADAIRRFRL